MARKPRIEFPGAVYHVFSRGNYRKELFREPGSGEAFIQALFEAAEFSNWLLHAYAIMPNHYHAVIETPDANLSVGMQWLQGTFGNRFNRVHGEHGHVFQGRFKSPLVEPGESLRRVVDYVHLNPVRASLVSVEGLRGYHLSSFHRFWQHPLPRRLVRGEFLKALHLPDTLEGMRSYQNWLATREVGDPNLEDRLRDEFETNWIVGTPGFQQAVQERFARIKPARDWGGPELHQLLQGKWEKIVREELMSRGRKEQDLRLSPKLADWKIEISRRLRTQSTAPNRWIASRLNMGHPSNVSRYQKRMPKSKG